jgi:hypothetical protein
MLDKAIEFEGFKEVLNIPSWLILQKRKLRPRKTKPFAKFDTKNH